MWIVYLLITIVMVALVLFAVYLYMSAPSTGSKRAGTEKLNVDYAHRGLHGDGVPENSLPAFAAAAAAGYGVELDVRLSADGIPVVFHDSSLERMCGDDVELSSRTAAELSWRRLDGTLYTIPTLEDALKAIKGRVPVLVELKGDTKDTALSEATARVLAGYDGKYCVQSFNPYLLGWFRKNAPRVARGLLYTDFRKNGTKSSMTNLLLLSMATNFIARPDFISVDEKCLTYFPVRLMQKFFGLTTFVWTIRDLDHVARYRSAKYASIFEGITPGSRRG